MKYRQLTQAQRYQISALRVAGKSQRQIATLLGCHSSTISRELRRNSVHGYEPERAQHQATIRRQTAFKRHKQSRACRVDCIVMPPGPKYTNYWYLRGGAMQKNTSITLGQHFDAFIAEQLKNGRYSSTSEVVRAGLRLLEESETRLATLRRLLKEGEDSGFEDYSYESFIRELDNEER
ncbi:type II toxin-antitoxin system ParD family antitoxin [Marinobacter sp.]|uniref:type II toxin-antitoxin system ParD family antitoxin n=1 Tax=Marinobacter sp. TaxID=50741 RepID=UPI0039767B51